jgi:nicotinamidase-related amidase
MKTIHGKLVYDSFEEMLNPAHTALLVIDLQNDFVSADGPLALAGNDISPVMKLLPKCAGFIDEARALGVMIVHVRFTNLPHGLSESPAILRTNLRMFNTVDFCIEGTRGAEIAEECSPREGDLVVSKHRSSAFVGTDLDQLLRSNGIETLVIIGHQTPGCVEATFRDAAYYDYYNVLIEDLVAAYRQDLHEASLLIQRARHDVCASTQVLDVWRNRDVDQRAFINPRRGIRAAEHA